MAGPGGGPPRRSHTKSRKGCDTCKRRHIRCDESFPQCRNCTKHKIRCPYNDVQTPESGRSTTPDKADLMWTPEIEASISQWRATGIFPLATLDVYPAPNPMIYTDEELRLIHHVATLWDNLFAIDANNFTLWTRHIPTLLSIGATTPYVMHALLAFSAMHIAFLTDCPLVGGMAFVYRGNALSGLHEAINSFSRETSDAILAASLVLSWQATDWSGWTQLMQGTSTVIEAMESWKHESLFAEFIADSRTFPTAPPSPGPDHRSSQPSKDDLEAFQRTLEQIQKVEVHLKSQNLETTQIQNLASFLKGSRKISPTLHIGQQFERLRSLRDWLFWMPVAYLQNPSCSPDSLVAIAHLYTAAIVMERMFPEIGSAYFGSLSLLPIEEIARRLSSICVSTGERTVLELIKFPVEVVGEFRSRMGLVPPGHSPFDHFGYDSPGYDNSHYEQDHSYSPYGNPVFSYSHEEMSMLNASGPPCGSPVPQPMPSHYGSHSYLDIPGSMYSGSYSPASSTLESSVAYSDPEEYGPYGMSRSVPASHSHSHSHSHSNSPMFQEAYHGFRAGFVTPKQPVWT